MKPEKVLIILKPDAINRSLVGEIIHRFERKALQIIGIKMMELEEAQLREHYSHLADKPFFADISAYMRSSPVVVIALEAPRAVAAARLIAGVTKGYEAAPGTIRGDFSMSGQMTIIHASDTPENGELEVSRFFKENELFSYDKATKRYMYDEDR